MTRAARRRAAARRSDGWAAKLYGRNIHPEAAMRIGVAKSPGRGGGPATRGGAARLVPRGQNGNVVAPRHWLRTKGNAVASNHPALCKARFLRDPD
jgi:hypothetical protein